MSEDETTAESEGTELLKLKYREVLAERDRLRSARASVTSRLGPLPASAAIAIGLVGTVADKVDRGYLGAAALLFVALVLISVLFGSLAPYRLLLAKRSGVKGDQPEGYLTSTSAASTQDAWLKDRIRSEERIYGRLRTSQHITLTRNPKDLQEAFDVERTVSNLVHLLFAAIIGVLVAGLLWS